MAFCTSCGGSIAPETKFCPECGKSTSADSASGIQRKQEFAGSIIKCPNCGEVLKSFQATCPSCAFELRETKASGSVQKLADKLEALETTRAQRSAADEDFDDSKIISQEIKLIQHCPIANTREDILEFFILASANMNSDHDIAKAWEAKCEQAYQKARLLLKSSADISEIEAIYIKVVRKGKAAKIKKVLPWVGLACMILIPFILLLSLNNKGTERKLEKLVEQVQICITNRDYNTARIKAKQIVDDSGWSSDSKKKWDDVRKSLLAQIDVLEGKQPAQYEPIPVGLSPEDMIGKNYESVVAQLEKNGFTNVDVEKSGGLFDGFVYGSNKVKEVRIEGKTDFTDESLYYPDALIIVVYYY